MFEREAAHEIDEVAAHWAVRVDVGDLSPEEQATLDAWLAGDPRRRGAYLRAKAGLRYIDQARAVQDRAPEPVEPVELPRPVRGPWGRYVAAGIGGLGAVAVAALFFVSRPMELHTGIGEVRRVALDGGSVATLNTDSDVEVAFAGNERRILLDRGEAWFEVAKNKERPFVVHAGAVRVRATGTAFSVHRLADGADIVVSEGTVLVWAEGASRAPAAVSAGQRFALRPGAAAPEGTARVKTSDALAWRTGGISFEGESIAAAAAEFNRYNKVQIEVADPAIGRQQVVGYFRASRPDQFADAAAQMSGAGVRRDKDRIILTRR